MQGLSPVPPAPKQRIDINPEIPAYRVVQKRGFLDDNDILHPLDALIYWEGAPNMGLQPINDIAMKKMREYLEALDKKMEEAAKLRGTQHLRMVNEFDARTRIRELDALESRRIGAEPEMQILGDKKKGKAGASSIGVGSATTIVNPPSRKPMAKTTNNGEI